MTLRSMTGFGRASSESELGTFVVEIRSVNNRHFDFHPRLPREWAAVETRVRDLVHRHIARGKVDLWIRWTPPPGLTLQVELNEAMVVEVARRFREAGKRAGVEIEVPWSDLFKLPGLLSIEAPELDGDALFAALESPIVRALDQLDAMRAAEGSAMAEAMANQLATMRRLTTRIEQERGSVLDRQRQRLRQLVEQMQSEVGRAISEDRLEAEVLLFADRADITEEITRLQSHYDAFERLLAPTEPKPSGKRMEFLCQEILREANTIGSKARDCEIGAAVIDLKHECEKIREQLQNIE